MAVNNAFNKNTTETIEIGEPVSSNACTGHPSSEISVVIAGPSCTPVLSHPFTGVPSLRPCVVTLALCKDSSNFAAFNSRCSLSTLLNSSSWVLAVLFSCKLAVMVLED